MLSIALDIWPFTALKCSVLSSSFVFNGELNIFWYLIINDGRVYLKCITKLSHYITNAVWNNILKYFHDPNPSRYIEIIPIGLGYSFSGPNWNHREVPWLSIVHVSKVSWFHGLTVYTFSLWVGNLSLQHDKNGSSFWSPSCMACLRRLVTRHNCMTCDYITKHAARCYCFINPLE